MNGMHYGYAMYSRVPVQIRLHATPLAQIDQEAKDYSMTRADVLRACLAVAFNHWNEVQKMLDAKSESL